MIKFGTGGWRAIIGDEFTKANVQLLACAVARKLKDEKMDQGGFVVGFDRRFLSEVAAKWICEVMAGENVPCQIILEDAPTPLIMFVVEKSKLSGGMAVTASHNPAIYNGIKVFIPGGRDADEIYTGEVEDYIQKLSADDIKIVDYDEAVKSGIVKVIKPMNAYIDSIIAAVNLDIIREKGLKIILDPMYGVSKTALQTILMTARCDVELIHERRDALFGGRLPAPHSNTLNSLISNVVEKGADIGIATDGDADRLGVIDNTGEFLHPNKILCMLYYYLLNYKGWKG
ncbi:MAG: phosphoglucomutase/phosphomannomutase family protein, partial [Oscillospiraceae bacterium]